jgi:ketosteroid isomerase-like protein
MTDVRSAEQVLDDHLRQGQSGSIDDDLARNYAEDAVVLSSRGVLRGHDGVRQMQSLNHEAASAKFTYYRKLVEGDVGFLEWSGESDHAVIRDGADSYVIREGKIAAQTVHYRVERRTTPP